MNADSLVFERWFAKRFGPRSSTSYRRKSDIQLDKIVKAGAWAKDEVYRRTLWDACKKAAQEAWEEEAKP